MAGLARTVWLEHGALDYRECRGDELDNEAFASFTKAAGAGPDETVVFAWILFASKAERDRINALARAIRVWPTWNAEASSIPSACAGAASRP